MKEIRLGIELKFIAIRLEIVTNHKSQLQGKMKYLKKLWRLCCLY